MQELFGENWRELRPEIAGCTSISYLLEGVVSLLMLFEITSANTANLIRNEIILR